MLGVHLFLAGLELWDSGIAGADDAARKDGFAAVRPVAYAARAADVRPPALSGVGKGVGSQGYEHAVWRPIFAVDRRAVGRSTHDDDFITSLYLSRTTYVPSNSGDDNFSYAPAAAPQ